MARGGRRTYTRDANGRFSSAPGGGGKARRPAARKAVMRSGNRLTRDNRGRISSIGGDGATARGGRLRTAGGGMRARQTAALRSTALRSGTIAKGGRGVSGSVARSLAAAKRGRQGKPAVNRQQQPLMPSQLRGQRRRASERPEVRLERAQARASRRLQELQSTKSSLETALRRRRGKLDEASKKAAAQNLSRTNRRIERLKDANALYRQDIGTASARRGSVMNYRTGKKVPETDATRQNRLGVLRRRVSYLRRNEVKPTDVWGGEYDGPQLSAARKALTAQATTGMQGMRVALRSKKQAAGAQRSRRNALIEKANATKYGLPGRGSGGKFGLGTKTVKLAIVQQGNMLTGKTDRVRGRRFMPAKPRRR